jgi:uncharacterized membrane protein
METLDLVTIMIAGILIGVEFAVSAFVNPVLERLEPEAEADSTRLFARLLGKVMPFWYVSCLILLIIESILRRQMPGACWLVTASAIWSGVILGTILWLVPINNRLAMMPAGGYSAGLRSLHQRWDWLHRGRVLLLVVALVCLLLALRV